MDGSLVTKWGLDKRETAISFRPGDCRGLRELREIARDCRRLQRIAGDCRRRRFGAGWGTTSRDSRVPRFLHFSEWGLIWVWIFITGMKTRFVHTYEKIALSYPLGAAFFHTPRGGGSGARSARSAGRLGREKVQENSVGSVGDGSRKVRSARSGTGP